MLKLKAKPVETLDMVWDSNRGIYTTLEDRTASENKDVQAYSNQHRRQRSAFDVGTIIALAPVAACLYVSSPFPLLIYVAVILKGLVKTSRPDLGGNPPMRRRKGRTNLPLADCRPGATGLTYECNK